MRAANPIGASTWIWVSPLDNAGLATLAPRLAAWGFDLIELPVERVTDWDPGAAAEVLARNRLGATVAAVMAPGRDLAVADGEVVRATQRYLEDCLELASRVGARVVAGPVYAATGRTWPLPAGERTATLERVAANLRPVVERAGELSVRIAVEPLNRFETSLVNTAEQALELVDRLDSLACGVLLDTFHMNIEERDPAAAVRACGGRLAHLHACGNDRGAPGGDGIAWPAIAAALGEVGYEGAVVIESFTVENQAIARAASIWRPLARSQDALATDGLAFLQRLLEENP